MLAKAGKRMTTCQSDPDLILAVLCLGCSTILLYTVTSLHYKAYALTVRVPCTQFMYSAILAFEMPASSLVPGRTACDLLIGGCDASDRQAVRVSTPPIR
eukprot:scaffold49448_cov25-Prasinocladus_malaysianus.AAC.1